MDPDLGLLSCLKTSGPALTECLNGGPCWSTRCWGLCGGLGGSPPLAPAAATRPCSFMYRLTWLCCGCCCCCFLRLYSIISLLMVLSVAMVYSLLPALSHHSFLRPGVAPPTELPKMPESRLSPPARKWCGRLPVLLHRRAHKMLVLHFEPKIRVFLYWDGETSGPAHNSVC